MNFGGEGYPVDRMLRVLAGDGMAGGKKIEIIKASSDAALVDAALRDGIRK